MSAAKGSSLSLSVPSALPRRGPADEPEGAIPADAGPATPAAVCGGAEGAQGDLADDASGGAGTVESEADAEAISKTLPDLPHRAAPPPLALEDEDAAFERRMNERAKFWLPHGAE